MPRQHRACRFDPPFKITLGERELVLPGRWEICGNCEGHGTHLRDAIREHAYSQEEFDREFDDDEREHYFRRGGMYDVQCETCKGSGKVVVPDEKCIPKNLMKRIQKSWDDDADYERLCKMERDFGC